MTGVLSAPLVSGMCGTLTDCLSLSPMQWKERQNLQRLTWFGWVWYELGHALVRLIGSLALHATLLDLVCNVCNHFNVCTHCFFLTCLVWTLDIMTLCYWAFYEVCLFLQVLTSGALTAVVYTPNSVMCLYMSAQRNVLGDRVGLYLLHENNCI